MNNVFIDALVRAGYCKEHSSQRRSSRFWSGHRPVHSPSRASDCSRVVDRARSYHQSNNLRQQNAVGDFTRDEYLDLLDYRRGNWDPGVEQDVKSDHHSQESADLPQLEHDTHSTSPSPANAPNRGNVSTSLERPSSRPKTSLSSSLDANPHKKIVARLEKALRPTECAHETAFDIYKTLPNPGVAYLPPKIIRLLFRQFSVVEQKNESSMLRYFTIVEDMRKANLPMTASEWNSAISFTGRCFSKVSRLEVESALHIWTEMEKDAGIPGNHVTFNVLFDIAVKGGKFVLADMILKEMSARGIDPRRYGRVGMIYFQGCKGNGEGVRQAYKNLVEDGEVVDTTVLNCVIAALFRAGEGQAAENVYERMKRLKASRGGTIPPPVEWRARRNLGKQLQLVSWSARSNGRRPDKTQRTTAMSPDIRTYRALVFHHTYRTGDLHRITELLHDMQFYYIPLDGSIYQLLMQGFANHGGVRYSIWKSSFLEDTWAALKLAVDRKPSRIYMGKHLVIWCLRAFSKCSGKARTVEVWEEIKVKWPLPGAEEQIGQRVLAQTLDD
ncbi:MAG: hypothetical protein M4579_005952 [Chaenotheca gracillima]|nr:MAG: hypothetical protein M4579_005952 [Chaenotheca gracillima]